jgi:hypothetical protein
LQGASSSTFLPRITPSSVSSWRIADEGCSASTLPRRRDEWIEERVMDALRGDDAQSL